MHHLKNKVEQLENKLEQVREKTDPLVGMAQHHHQTQRRLQVQVLHCNQKSCTVQVFLKMENFPSLHL